MKWKVQTNGEGYYWWEAVVPVGLLEVVYPSPEKFGCKWEAHWYANRNESVPMILGSAGTEDEAKALAVSELKKIVRRWSRALR